MGNSQGHDELCGHRLNYSTNAMHLCCYCNCPTNETDNTDYVFCYTKQLDTEEHLCNNNTTSLKSIGYVNI